jgi:hypothetical protein
MVADDCPAGATARCDVTFGKTQERHLYYSPDQAVAADECKQLNGELRAPQ